MILNTSQPSWALVCLKCLLSLLCPQEVFWPGERSLAVYCLLPVMGERPWQGLYSSSENKGGIFSLSVLELIWLPVDHTMGMRDSTHHMPVFITDKWPLGVGMVKSW